MCTNKTTGEVDTAEMLIRNGASINIVNYEGRTPLDESIDLGN